MWAYFVGIVASQPLFRPYVLNILTHPPRTYLKVKFTNPEIVKNYFKLGLNKGRISIPVELQAASNSDSDILNIGFALGILIEHADMIDPDDQLLSIHSAKQPK